jgi:hypothetical protein
VSAFKFRFGVLHPRNWRLAVAAPPLAFGASKINHVAGVLGEGDGHRGE